MAVARLLYEQGHYDFSASRSYYSMFYMAEALLLGRGLAFSKHSAVIAAFGRAFVKPGIVPPALHLNIRAAEEARLIGDYASQRHVGQESALRHLSHADEFVSVVERLLAS